VKRALPPGHGLVVGTVGSITDGHIAQGVLDKNQADVVIVGRQFQKNPGTVWAFADDLGVAIQKARQIGWAFHGRAKRPVTRDDRLSNL
jgi:2,4-dienoyl-CoA reductase-like NADH-dependent reductase (Old Yellow Enzyme family)